MQYYLNVTSIKNFNFLFFILMPGGRARGNPVQIFSEIYQKFPPTDLKNIFRIYIS